MRPMTPAMVLMLRTAIEHPDGSVMARGFNRGLNSPATAKALHARGYLVWHRRSLLSGDIWKITDAGRAALRK